MSKDLHTVFLSESVQTWMLKAFGKFTVGRLHKNGQIFIGSEHSVSMGIHWELWAVRLFW